MVVLLVLQQPPTGVSHDFTLDFVESDDFRTLAFNALPGEDGHNPEIRVSSGDESNHYYY